jgi:hypothetical protein
MNNVESMRNEALSGGSVLPPPEEEAKARLYHTEDKKSLGVPGVALHRALIKATGGFKFGKSTLSSLVVSCVHVGPKEIIPLNTLEYTLDSRSVMIKGRGRVSRVRPKIWPWGLDCELSFDETMIPLKGFGEKLPLIIKRAGTLVGILDFRPEKKGQFGQFRATKIELLEAREVEPFPEPEFIWRAA